MGILHLSRYYETWRRQNYVTPTSYLELIKTFKLLLNDKRMEILNRKFRYQAGLEKIDFSEKQVSRIRTILLSNHLASCQRGIRTFRPFDLIH